MSLKDKKSSPLNIEAFSKNKQLISLGASVAQLHTSIEQIEAARKNLEYAKVLNDDQRAKILLSYTLLIQVQNDVHKIIKKETN